MSLSSPPGEQQPATTTTNVLHEDLADQIVRLAIRENYSRGHHLTELALARLFRVSRSPIRSALKHLQDLGVVSAEANRGFFLDQDGATLSQAFHKGAMPVQIKIYDLILRDYASGQLSETVTERQLTTRYEVGLAELRAALSRLVEHGILRRNQGKGWHFEPGLTSGEALEQSYRFRMIVECGAILEPSFTLDKPVCDRIREAHGRFLEQLGDRSAFEFFAINSDFHLFIAESSGNLFVKKAVEIQNRLRRLHELANFPRLNLDRMRQSCNEHIAILDALEVGDTSGAHRLMKEHLSHAPRK